MSSRSSAFTGIGRRESAMSSRTSLWTCGAFLLALLASHIAASGWLRECCLPSLLFGGNDRFNIFSQ
jgi:hypothetical protein